MINFDIRTLSFLVMLSSLLLAIGLQIVNYVIKKDTSLRLWAIGETVIGIGMVLVWLRSFIPDYLSIVLSNTLLITGVGFQYLGTLSFQGKKSRFPWFWCLSFLTAILFIYFTYFVPNLSARIVAYTIIAATLRVTIAVIILRPNDGQARLVHWFVAMGYMVNVIFMVIRGAFNLFMGPTDQNLMAASSMIQALYFVSEIGFRLVLAIGLPLLVFGRTHRLLIAGEHSYRTMIELSPAPILVLYDDKISYVNPATIKMLGANSAQDLVDKSYLDFVNPDLRQFVLMRIQTALTTGDTNPKVEEILIKLDGTAITAEVQSTPILYSGQAAIQIIINDITERKRNDLLIQELICRLEQEKDNAQKDAMTDELTRLANRRNFDTTFAREFSRLKRSKGILSLLMMDIDHFKKYNDFYGHIGGDDCLRKVAAAIQATIGRAPDFAARYGGEEFVAILPETGKQGASIVAERIRKNIEALSIPHQSSDNASVVTISLGVVSIHPNQAENPEHVIKLADQALFLAKKGGRNRFEVAFGNYDNSAAFENARFL